MEVSVHQAKAQLSRLLERAATGEEVVITKAGRPVAKLVPVVSQNTRWLGSAKGEFTVPDDFNDPLPKEIVQSKQWRTPRGIRCSVEAIGVLRLAVACAPASLRMTRAISSAHTKNQL